MDYIFQTGHGKELAKAEILSVLGDPTNTNGTILDEVDDGFVVRTDLRDAQALLNNMGGIVRITEILSSGPAAMPLNFEEWIVKAMKNEIKAPAEEKGVGKLGKTRFGLSMHPKSEKILKKILINSKKNLKSSLGNTRFVNKDFQNLSSVQAWHENLLAEGAIELHLFKSIDASAAASSALKWYLSKTLAIQDFEWYSHRDFDRPERSARNGMLPPKLAQILINLATPAVPSVPGHGATPSTAVPEHETTIFDPFCGTGTVLQEALLMGYAALGSDIEATLIESAETNLKWLRTEVENAFDSDLPASTLFQCDATALASKDLPSATSKNNFVIVSETTLGPPLSELPSPSRLKEIQADLESLYSAFFKNLKRIISSKVTVVFTAPYHKDRDDRYLLPYLPQILESYGDIVALSENSRPSLFYERKDQTVGREIWKIICEP
ncbi:MAG: hypothetical protein WC846_05310 [Candidatus Gracilibacteria bacterium]|jgi:tRNA G10  N-methylase Trm11